nr:MAG TPA: hypothetical protein [Caudoviricetes sp.]
MRRTKGGPMIPLSVKLMGVFFYAADDAILLRLCRRAGRHPHPGLERHPTDRRLHRTLQGDGACGQ